MKKGDLYRHFKGGPYRFLMEAQESETEEAVIVYQSVLSDLVWVRKKSEFFGETEGGVKRVQFVGTGLVAGLVAGIETAITDLESQG